MQDPVQNITLPLAHVLGLLVAVTVSQIFLTFDDVDSFEEYCSGAFQEGPLLKFI